MRATHGSIALVGAITLAGGAFAGEGATDADLRSRVAELEARLATLQAQNGDQWLTEARAAEIRSLVQDVLADADTRTSLI